jgi:DNA-binding NarL/FixJ family response regulator
MIKIAIAEDNSFLVKTLVNKLSFFDDIVVKFASENGNDLIKMLDKNHNIDVILMDIQMPEMDGIKATEIIKKKYPQIKIMMLTIYDDDDSVFKAIKAGANGYILKETDPRSMYENINELLSGGAPMTPSIASKTLKILRSNNYNVTGGEQKDFDLSKRQLQILEQLTKGLNYNEIAANLFISPSTVRKHIENIYAKLEVHSKIEAIQKAQKFRLF